MVCASCQNSEAASGSPSMGAKIMFTGTPAGVGSVRTPRRYLAPGERIETEIEGLGTLVNRCVEPGPT